MLRLSGLCKRFEDLPVLSNLSLTLSRGEIVALIGPSGCGKTTLLNIISGLTAPDAGTVEGVDGRLSYMFQSARLLPWRTVEENIRLVREDAPAEEARSLITAVGLEGVERYYPGQLSGGMARPRMGWLAVCRSLMSWEGSGGSWGGRRATRFQEGFPFSPHFAFTLFPSRPEWRGPHRRGRGPW